MTVNSDIAIYIAIYIAIPLHDAKRIGRQRQPEPLHPYTAALSHVRRRRLSSF